jgi:hypothetical protein
MRVPFFSRGASREAAVYAEAQALADRGFAEEDVLARFDDDAEWLRGMLTTGTGIQKTLSSEQPSFYFEASLKSKFLAAANETQQARVPAANGILRFRGAMVGVAFVAFAGILGVFSFGFVTADQSVPGDWNYTFKLANERLQYALSRGDARVNVQINTTEARVFEIQQLSKSGGLSAGDIQNLQKQAQELADAARQQPLDTLQKTRVAGIQQTSTAVLSDVKTKNTDLQPVVDTAIQTVNEAAFAAGVGAGPTVLPAVTPTPAVSPTPAATATATGTPATPKPTSTPTPSPVATPSPTAAPSTTAVPSPTATSDPAPSATATPAPSATPDSQTPQAKSTATP